MSVRKIRSSWWVDFRFDRERYRLKSPENSRQGAAAYELVVRQRLARGEAARRTEPVKKSLTFGKFAAEWFETYVKTNNKHSEQKSKEFTLRLHLVPEFGKTPLDRLTAPMVEAYKAKKLEAGLSPKSVNNHLAILAKCLRTANEWDKLDKLIKIKMLKAVSQRLDFLTPEESQQLINRARVPMWEVMVHVALRTGMRLGELIGLEWRAIDLARGLLAVERAIVLGRVGTPKNGKTRHIPLTSDALAALRRLDTRDSFVFCRPNGTALNQSWAARVLRRMCKNAGVRVVSWHVLRHTFASHLAAKGVPLPAIMSLLGHSSIGMTMRYAHLAPSALFDAVRVLEPAASQEEVGQPVGNTRSFDGGHGIILKKALASIHANADAKKSRNEAAFTKDIRRPIRHFLRNPQKGGQRELKLPEPPLECGGNAAK